MHTAPSLSEVQSWFSAHEAQCFDLVLAGQVFGGRYGESPQRVKSALLTPDSLLVQFSPTEVLSITAPEGILLEPEGMFVSLASEVTFGWHCYGRDRTPENWCELHYSFSRNRVQEQSSGPTRARSRLFSFEGKYAVSLVRGA